jgi:hypothetical protein
VSRACGGCHKLYRANRRCGEVFAQRLPTFFNVAVVFANILLVPACEIADDDDDAPR